jgi:putative peptidoglycan binding protein
MKTRRILPGLLAVAALVGCDTKGPDLDSAETPQVARQAQDAPPGAEPGTCWGKHAIPAIIETVTHQTLVRPAKTAGDGTIIQPAKYKTESRQDIVRPRKDTWFETPCAEVQTPEFVASLQRALAARGAYRGTPTGQMDAATRAAIRRYQQQQGLDSSILSLDTARALGLVAVTRAPSG